MRITFVQPALLLLLLVLLPMWALTLATRASLGRRVARWRMWTALVLRTLALSALVLALAGMQLVRNASDLTTVFILDSSDSISPAARARGEAYIQTAVQHMPVGDKAAVVVFGADAAVERPPSDQKQLDRLRLVPSGTATDIGGALRLGLATLPAGSMRRIVLLSDGSENSFRAGVTAIDVAAEARAAGVPIETVSLAGEHSNDDVAIEGVEAPATAREGQMVRLTVQARSQLTSRTTARLTLLRNRQLILDTAVDLNPGINRIPVTAEAPRGFHIWEVRIAAPNDAVAANNVGFAFTDVHGPPHILLLEGTPGVASNLQAALASAGIEAEVQRPEAMPQTLIGLDPYDAVALVDVPFRALPASAAKLLPMYVRELGRGLLMVGGPDSYAAGGYLDTPIEDVLPVTVRTRGADIRPDLALVLVIDRSGSMSGQKLELAKEGVAQAYAALEKDDQVGLIAFDTSADWILPLQKKPPVDNFLNGISQVSEGGGTDLRPGLEQAANALEGADAKIKHVVLLTDGQADHNYDDIVARMKADQITLSTVGVGDGYDPHLKDIAPEAGGRFYGVENFSDIPRLFFDETLRVARRGIVEEDFTPRLSDPFGPLAGVVRGLGGVAPLHGYNAVTARQTAQVPLVAPNGDPILAEWQYGLGRSVAWTSDMRGQWGRDWVTASNFGSFAAGLVSSMINHSLGEGYEARASISGAALAVEMRVDSPASPGNDRLRASGKLVAADGSTIDVPLTEREAGLYRGTVALPDAGVYRVQIVTTAPDGTTKLVAATGAVVPASAEYLHPEGNPGLLKAIADTTGGHVELPPTSAFVPTARPAFRAAPMTWPLLWLTILLWPLDIAVRRLLLPWDRMSSLLRLPARALGSRPSAQPMTPSLRHAEVRQRVRQRERTASDMPAEATATTVEPVSHNQGTTTAVSTSLEQAETNIPAAPVRPNWRTARRTLPERPGKDKR